MFNDINVLQAMYKPVTYVDLTPFEILNAEVVGNAY